MYPTNGGSGGGNLSKDYFGEQKLSLAAAAAAGNCNQSVAFRAAAAAVAYGRGAGYGGYAPDVVAAAAASDVDKYI